MRITLLFFLLLIKLQVSGQEFSIEHYTDENGLPQNSVKSIATDNAGFIWLATENGLVRYDGQLFRLFEKNKTKANSNRIVNLKKDSNNDKLYGVTENWQLVEIKNGKTSSSPISYESKFSFENSTHKTHIFASGIPNGSESFITGLPYIITKKNGYTYKIHNGNVALYQKNKLICNLKFSYKNQWRFFLLDSELYYIDEQLKVTRFETDKYIEVKLTGEIAKQTVKNHTRLFWNINTEDLFINIGNALYCLNHEIKTDQITSKKILKNVNLTELGALSIYRNKTLGQTYVGTLTKGLYIFKEKQFNTLVTKTSDHHNVFYAQIPFKNNTILSASGYLLDKNKPKVSSNLFTHQSDRHTIAIDSHKNVWTTKERNIYKLSPDVKKVIDSYKLPSAVNTISIDHEEAVWVGSTKGVYKLKKNAKSFTPLALLKNIDNVRCLENTKETLWIGTDNGLFYYNFAKRKVYEIKALLHKQIRSIHTRNDEVWITTYGDGLYLFKGDTLVRLPNDRNNYLNTAHCILEDKNGFFWISTNKGLFKAAIADLMAYVNKKTASVYYIYYNRSAGFNTNEFNGGCQPCGAILNDGDFTFPTMSGIAFFNPLKIIDNNPSQPIFIDKIILDNDELASSDEELKVPNSFNKLKIHLTTPYFGNKENLNFEHKLANQDTWYQSQDQIITFSSLPTGKNVLNIRKANGFGPENYAYKNIYIIVPLYFYQTWWFILGTAACFILIVYLAIKLRTKRISDRNLQLKRTVNDRTLELQGIIKAYEFSKNRLDHQNYFQSRLISAITHDIKSPLKYVMMTSEALIKDDSKIVDKQGLEAIYTSSSQIYHFTDNLVQYAKGFDVEDLNKKQLFNLHNLIAEKISIFSPIAENQNTAIFNDINSDVVVNINKPLLSVILHNLLDNAVKFTYKGEITFSYARLETSYKIIIKDSGIGMKHYQVDWCNSKDDSLSQTSSIQNKISPAGLGLIMVKELIKIIDGKILAKAVAGEGTTVEITLND